MLLALITAACAAQAPQTPIIQTVVQTVIVTATSEPPTVPTQTPVPPPSVVPSAIPTLAPPAFTANVGANCRSGPSVEYDVLAGINAGKVVPIVGQSAPDRTEKWWLVNYNGITCWVWSALGFTTGNLDKIQPVVAPYLPPHRYLIAVEINNNTDNHICQANFYTKNDVFIKSFVWEKGDLDENDSVKVYLAAGRYNIYLFNCQGDKKFNYKNYRIDTDHNAIDINMP